MLCSTPELTALNRIQERLRLCLTFSLLTPHRVATTGLVNLPEKLSMGDEFLIIGQQYRQFNARQVDLHDAATGIFSRSDIDQQGFLPTRQIYIDVSQQFGVEQRAVQGPS